MVSSKPFLSAPHWNSYHSGMSQWTCRHIHQALDLDAESWAWFSTTNSDSVEENTNCSRSFSRSRSQHTCDMLRAACIAKLNSKVSFIGFGCNWQRFQHFMRSTWVAMLPPFSMQRTSRTQSSPMYHVRIHRRSHNDTYMNLEHVIMFAYTFKLCTYINGAALFATLQRTAHMARDLVA